MKSFPMFIVVANRRVVIAGGGEQAAQKARLLLKTEAKIVLAAPDLDDELQALVDEGRATHIRDETAGVFADAALVFIATGDEDHDAALHGVAKSVGALVNVVDRPDLCDVTTPSIVDRDPVVVAIGTEGTAPILARGLKTRIEQLLDPRLGAFAALAGRLRVAVARDVEPQKRRAFWRWAFGQGPWQAFKRGAERDAAKMLKQAIAAGGAGDTGGGITLISLPETRDLLTLRAVERLQEADVIYYDGPLPDILELARRDAERRQLQPDLPGAEAMMARDAAEGRNVVRILGAGQGCARFTSLIDVDVECVPGLQCAGKPGCIPDM